jgi:HPt (histidine-containing phosphotransfer) domain-containing protein
MFFIQNSEGVIVAADAAFLQAAELDSPYRLAETIRVPIPSDDAEELVLDIGENETTFSIRTLQTLWGPMRLYRATEPETAEAAEDEHRAVAPLVSTEETEETASDDASVSVPSEEEEPSSDTDATLLLEEETVSTEQTESPESDEETEPLLLEDAPFDIAEAGDETTVDTKETPETDDQAQEELLELIDLPDLQPSSDEADADDTQNEHAGLAATGAALAGTLGAGTITLLDRDDASDETENDTTPDHDEMHSEADETDEAIFDLLEPDHADTPLDETPALQSDTDEEPLSIESPAEHAADTEEEALPETARDDETPIGDEAPTSFAPSSEAPFFDYEQTAKIIGISLGDYRTFLERFADEAIQSESVLRGHDLGAYRDSLTSLKDASQLLHLPKLTEELRKLDEATSEEKQSILDTFYGMVEHIRTDLQHLPAAAAESSEVSDETVSEPPHLSESALAPEPETEETPDAETGAATVTVDVDELIRNAVSVPFDFSASVASAELGLPEDLVNEFVIDFIQQAKENIPTLVEAKESADMETLQSTAHLLKGAASNLRIDPLAETLKDLQYNDDWDQVPHLFDRFIGQLKALDNLINRPGT